MASIYGRSARRAVSSGVEMIGSGTNAGLVSFEAVRLKIGFMDKLTPVDRSAVMAKVRSRNTGPELRVRRLAHRAGYRFRLHRRDLPGSPDLVFPRHRLAVFVHGCFWHQHPGCKRATVPSSNAPKWIKKFEANQARDANADAQLLTLGWKVLVIWECETRSEPTIMNKINCAIRWSRDTASCPGLKLP